MRDIFATRLMQPSSTRHSLLMGPIDGFFFYARGPRPCNQWGIEREWFERMRELFSDLLHEPNLCVLLSKLGMQIAPRAMKRV